MECPESARLQAYFDGEVDALTAQQVELHLESCAACRQLLQELESSRAQLRHNFAHETAPPELRQRIERALDQTSTDPGPVRAVKPRSLWRVPQFWTGAVAGLGCTAAAAVVMFSLGLSSARHSLATDVVSAHIRSLMPSHLVDVLSTDHHTVKPWFSGHADVSPLVADFSAQGYRLVGGRADYLDQHRSAVVVYQHGSHIINVFSLPVSRQSLPARSTHDGYHMSCWKETDLQYCAVSDTGWDELLGLVRLIRDQDAREAPPPP